MKILNTIQELWDYCLYCPLCKESCRKIDISVGPDDYFNLISFKKNNEKLNLKGRLLSGNQIYIVNYTINCLDNSFDVKFSLTDDIKENPYNLVAPYFYFYINGDCEKCNRSYINGSDLEFDNENKKIANIGIDREGIYLVSEHDGFHVDLQYNANKTIIYKCAEDRHGTIADFVPGYVCNLIKINFLDADKAINKIKTLLTFS